MPNSKKASETLPYGSHAWYDQVEREADLEMLEKRAQLREEAKQSATVEQAGGDPDEVPKASDLPQAD